MTTTHNLISEKRNLDISRQDSKTTELENKDKHIGDITSGFSDTSDDDETDLTNIASGLAHQQGDFFFGDGEGGENVFAYENLTGMEPTGGQGLVIVSIDCQIIWHFCWS
jgi:hypothetical protein